MDEQSPSNIVPIIVTVIVIIVLLMAVAILNRGKADNSTEPDAEPSITANRSGLE